MYRNRYNGRAQVTFSRSTTIDASLDERRESAMRQLPSWLGQQVI